MSEPKCRTCIWSNECATVCHRGQDQEIKDPETTLPGCVSFEDRADFE